MFSKDPADVCEVELERVWAKPTGPPLITSVAFVFDDADHAREAFRARSRLVSYGAPLWPHTEHNVDLGDEGRLLFGRGLNDPAVGVVWRSGNVIGELVVEPPDEHAALMYARRQQRRIEGAAPPPAPTDTVEIELDDPTLKLPVYWLGRSFDPSGHLPTLQLEAADVLGTGPGNTVKLDYVGVANGRTTGVTVDLWRPTAWDRFRRTLLGRLVWDSPCAQKRTVLLGNGRADIFAGYGTPRPLARPCPARPPDRVIAHVYLPHVVVAVDMPYCYACAERVSPNPYETVAGMTAIARGLRLRTP